MGKNPRRSREPQPWAYDLQDDEIRREKAKARELRATQWWKRKCDRGICHYCGARVPARELTMDHVIPLARGGKTTKANVVPCCKECNNRKRQLLPMEWQEYLSRIAEGKDTA